MAGVMVHMNGRGWEEQCLVRGFMIIGDCGNLSSFPIKRVRTISLQE
jgi:hypothetical protein